MQFQLLITVSEKKITDVVKLDNSIAVQTSNYVKIYQNDQLKKAIQFKGKRLELFGRTLISFDCDQLLIIQENQSELLELHKIISVSREMLEIVQVTAQSGFIIITSGNYLIHLSQQYKVRKIKQIIENLAQIQLSDTQILLRTVGAATNTQNAQNDQNSPNNAIQRNLRTQNHLLLDLATFDVLYVIQRSNLLLLQNDDIFDQNAQEIVQIQRIGINQRAYQRIMHLQAANAPTLLEQQFYRYENQFVLKSPKFSLIAVQELNQIVVQLQYNNHIIQMIQIISESQVVALFEISANYLVYAILTQKQMFLVNFAVQKVADIVFLPTEITSGAGIRVRINENIIQIQSGDDIIEFSYDLAKIVSSMFFDIQENFALFEETSSTTPRELVIQSDSDSFE